MIEPVSHPNADADPIDGYGAIDEDDLSTEPHDVLVPRTAALALAYLCELSGVDCRVLDLSTERGVTSDRMRDAMDELASDPFWVSIGVRPSRPAVLTSRLDPVRLHDVLAGIPRVSVEASDWARVDGEAEIYSHGMPVEDVSDAALARARDTDATVLRMMRMAEDGDEIGAVLLGLSHAGVGA